MNNTQQQAKREKSKALITEYEESGLSQVDFCRQKELSPAQFGYYRGAFQAKQRAPKEMTRAFSPVKISQQSSSNEIRITLPNGFQCAFSTEVEASRIKELIGVILSC